MIDHGFGLVAQGSIPLTCVGLVALFQIVIIRLTRLTLTGHRSFAKEVLPMKKTNRIRRLLSQMFLDTNWVTEAGCVAGSLPA